MVTMMKNRLIGAVLLVIGAVTAFALPPGPPPGSPPQADTSAIAHKWLDLSYAAVSATQRLDIFLPDSGKGPFPVIVSIHGGGFMIGSRKSGELTPMLAGLKRGYAVVSVEYRLSSEAIFPAAVQDIKTAIRFLRAHAVEYRLDPAKIAVWGGSAGGNLAAILGASGGDAYLEGANLGNPEQSSRVQAVVDWFGPIWFSTMDAEFKALGQTSVMAVNSNADSFESRYLGQTIGTVAAEPLVKLASPLSYVDVKDPPCYIQHGTADRLIPITQSRNYADKLASVIGRDKVIYEALPGAGHGGEEFTTEANLTKILAFLDKYLK